MAFLISQPTACAPAPSKRSDPSRLASPSPETLRWGWREGELYRLEEPLLERFPYLAGKESPWASEDLPQLGDFYIGPTCPHSI